MINKAIKKQIQDVIKFGECSQEDQNGETISVLDLLKVYKDRKNILNNFCSQNLSYIDKNLDFIKWIEVSGESNSEGLVTLIFRLEDNKSTLIEFDKDNKIKSVSHTFDSNIKPVGNSLNTKISGDALYEFNYLDAILSKYNYLFKDIADYCVANNYNDSTMIKTISNEFCINYSSSAFSTSIPSKILDIFHKYVYLIYRYNPYLLNNEKVINTGLGMFAISTNVRGVKNLLNSEDKYAGLNNTILFLKNLQVYESDIPEYLKPEIEKVKVLKR